MQSIITQSKVLDIEYQELVGNINDLLDNLSAVSLEFVNSKLIFLDKYSKTLKPSQVEARQHRNHQIKNLIEYVKLHRRSKVKSQFQSPSQKAKHRPKYSFNEKALVETLKNPTFQTHQDEVQSKIYQTITNETKEIAKKDNIRVVLADLINRQKKEQRQGQDEMFSLLQKSMCLLEENRHHFEKEYQTIDKQYQEFLKHNKGFQAKANLQAQSHKIKENIHSLIQSQQSFQSYLNSIK